MSVIKFATAFTLAVSATAIVQAEDIAIVGGKVVTMGEAGTLESATVLIKDGKITSVGTNIAIPEGYRVIDASGKWVTPGFMVPLTALGLYEGPSWAGVNDANASNASIGTGLDVTWSINPTQSGFDIHRIEGVTRATTNINRTKTLFSGQGAVISLDDDASVQKAKAYVSVSFGDRASSRVGGRSAAWYDINKALDEAQKYIDDNKPKPAAKTSKKSKKSKEEPAAPKKPEVSDKTVNRDALVNVLKGDATLVVYASLKRDLENLIQLQKKFPNMKMVIAGAEEAWMVADQLAEAGVGVIIDTMANLPGSFENIGATQQNAARLEKAGVKVAFIPNDIGDNARLVVQSAGNAVANGMSWQGAMAAMTTAPASMFGVDETYGTLSAGMDADVVVWNGDPLEVMVSPDAVLIGGSEIPMTSRQTELRDRYLNLTRSPAYVK